jgi:hypothetical protein
MQGFIVLLEKMLTWAGPSVTWTQKNIHLLLSHAAANLQLARGTTKHPNIQGHHQGSLPRHVIAATELTP